MNSLFDSLYIISLISAYLAGVMRLRTDQSEGASKLSWIFPRTTLLVALAIAIPTTLQFFYPIVLNTFERDYDQFLAGDWWRFLTPLFVQDGGLSGSIFNLVSLFLIGTVAEQLWGIREWLIIFFGGGVLSELVAFAWQPIGAGNSVANFSLAASIAISCLVPGLSRPARIVAVFALGGGAVLFFLKDIHGAAMLIGSLIAVGLIWLNRRARSEST